MRKRALRIRVDLGAIKHNLSMARERSGQQKLFAVVKADAYGHGAVQVASALDEADGFAVVTVQEAIELRSASIKKPILVLQGAYDRSDCIEFRKHKLWPVIHCEQQLEWFRHSPESSNYQAWLKIDTGMGRLGFQPKRARELLQDSAGINWHGVLTHFASADNPASAKTDIQIECFTSLTSGTDLQKSMANSAAVLTSAASRADWARPGIMLYGSDPVDATQHQPAELQSAMRVSAPIIAMKRYEANESIGYAESFVCPTAMDVAYVAIGYGDGLPRVLGAGASVWVNGHICPVIGRVSMDSIAIDLLATKNTSTSVNLGDEAVLWGPEHPVEILAAAAHTISYELMTSIKGLREYD